MSGSDQTHPNTLASSRVLVIGGTSGLGAAVASATLANGGRVHISSSNPDKIATKIAELKALYPEAAATGTAADMSDEKTLEQNVKHVLEEAVKALGGPLDHVVYTAGNQRQNNPLSQLDATKYFQGWTVRYLGPLLFAKVISSSPGAYLKVDAHSSITLTSGLLAHRPLPGVGHTVGWAGALEAAARGLAVDMAPVRVNVIVPGAIHTELLAGYGEAMIQKFRELTLVKRVGWPSEAAEAYLFAMRSAFFTGQTIKIDGGASFV